MASLCHLNECVFFSCNAQGDYFRLFWKPLRTPEVTGVAHSFLCILCGVPISLHSKHPPEDISLEVSLFCQLQWESLSACKLLKFM